LNDDALGGGKAVSGFKVVIDGFEGPLDLLMFLVRKNEVPIEEVPVTRIMLQYLEFLELVQPVNVDLAGDVIATAATLAYMKSKLLLPPGGPSAETEEEGLTAEEGGETLREYLQFKGVAAKLEGREILDRDVFSRDFIPEELRDRQEKDVLVRLSVFDLLVAFKNLMDSMTPSMVLDVREMEWSLEDKISEIVEQLQTTGDGLLADLLKRGTRRELIVVFLALLELVRLGLVRVYEQAADGAIRVFLNLETVCEGGTADHGGGESEGIA